MQREREGTGDPRQKANEQSDCVDRRTHEDARCTRQQPCHCENYVNKSMRENLRREGDLDDDATDLAQSRRPAWAAH
jgi:hypothetical protein